MKSLMVMHKNFPGGAYCEEFGAAIHPITYSGSGLPIIWQVAHRAR